MKKSYFRKLRISPQWMSEWLQKSGVTIENQNIDDRVITIIARNLKR